MYSKKGCVFLELALILLTFIIACMFIKYFFKKIIFFIFILFSSGCISLAFKIPYSVSICSFCILLYSIKCIFLEFKFLGMNIIKPCKLYLNGYYEKLVYLLFSLNYIVFMSICYIFLVSKSMYILEVLDLVIAFCLTWISIWLVGRMRSIFINYININKFEI